MSELMRPYEFEFFRHGVAMAAMAGGLCGLLGVFVVVKAMSYIGHGLSHALFGGYAASTLLGVHVVIGAGAWGVASSLLIAAVTRRGAIRADAAIGVVTTASFALGLALFALFGRRGSNYEAALFGSVLGVSRADVAAVGAVVVVVVVAIAMGYRQLLFATFDPEVAHASGVPTGRVEAALLILLTVTILATMQVLGVTLIAASLVIPATVARLLTNSFARMLALSTLIGTATGFVGMNLSYHLDIPSGPTIVLVGATAFVIAFAATTRRPGALGSWRRG